MTKWLKGKRTLIFNALACVPVALEFMLPFFAMPEVRAVLPEGWMPWYALGLAGGNMLLRLITTTPVGRAQ